MTGKGEWTKEWPTEPGCYFFYGWHSMNQHGDNLKLFLVEARRNAFGTLSFIVGFRCLYKEEGAHGVWQKATLPELPPNELFK